MCNLIYPQITLAEKEATRKDFLASVEKIGNLREHFSASGCSFGFKNSSLCSLFSTLASKTFYSLPFFNLDDLGKNQITLETFFLRVARTIIPTKYYFCYKGCYTYCTGTYYGLVFFGTGGSKEQMQDQLNCVAEGIF